MNSEFFTHSSPTRKEAHSTLASPSKSPVAPVRRSERGNNLALHRWLGNHALQRFAESLLQRQAVPEEEELQMKAAPEGAMMQASPEVTDDILSRRGSGAAISSEVRQPLESFFGQNFENVRVHTDTAADTLSRQVGAEAFTVGQDIFFRSGRYEPSSQRGIELLSHEMTHVVQQSGTAAIARSTEGLEVSQPGDVYEQEADAVARQATAAVVQRKTGCSCGGTCASCRGEETET
jgi:hypothetical protein